MFSWSVSILLFIASFIFISLGLAYLVFLISFYLSNKTSLLGVYHRIEKESSLLEISKEIFWDKIWNVYKINFVLSIPLFIALLYLIYPTLPKDDPEELRKFYFGITAIISTIPAYLLSLRLLSHPTKNSIFKVPIMDFITTVDKKREMRDALKERFLSFYFSLPLATILVLIILLLRRLLISGLEINLSSFASKVPLELVIVLIISYPIALFIITILGEVWLFIKEPVDQI